MVLLAEEILFSVAALVSFVLHIVGISTCRWWLVRNKLVNGSMATSSFGLWLKQTCMDDTCEAETRSLSGELAWLLGVATIEAVSAAMYGLTLLISAFMLYRSLRKHGADIQKKLYVVFMSGAGAVIIVGILIFVKKKAGLTETFAMDTKDGTASWSLILSTTGGALGMLAGITMGTRLICKTKEYDDEENDRNEKSAAYWHQKHKEIN